MVSSLRFALLMVAALAASVSQADDIFFDSSFTTGEGYSDGSLPDNSADLISQPGFSISDAAGSGTLNGGPSFQRALFGVVGTTMDKDYLNNTANEVRVSVFGLVFNPTNQNVARFGLSDFDVSNPTGGSQLAAGVRFAYRASDSNLFLDRSLSGFPINFDVNTGVVAGETFDYEQRFKALGGGIFDIEHYINGSLLTTSSNITPNFSFSGSKVTGMIQGQGAAGAYSMDGLRLSGFSNVPEPSSLGLFAVGIAAFAGRRRRR